VFNYKDLFKDKVVDYFVSEYKSGRTPNPCIECNRHIKFSEFLNKAAALGFDCIATGHYAKIAFNSQTGRYGLFKGKYDYKDQSYVLYNLTQRQLSKTLMPLGDYDKKDVRRIAEENNLIVSKKPDSQDICFVPDGNYTAFLEKYTGEKSPIGSFVDINGKKLCAHKGLWHYTIGQRKGLGASFGKPMYVADIDISTNNVTVSDEEYIFKSELIADDINLIAFDKLEQPIEAAAKIRYSHKPAKAVVYPVGNDKIKVVFQEPQRAITKGQAVVLYNGDEIIGGGIIAEIP